MPPGRAAIVVDRAQGSRADHTILRHLGYLLQPAYCAPGAVVDRRVEHQQSECARQAITGNSPPVVALVERLRGIEGKVDDIQVGIRRGADAIPGSTTDAAPNLATGPVARVLAIGREAAFVAQDDVEHAVEAGHIGQPGLSLSAIGADVAASGKSRCQSAPAPLRSAPISQPAGFASTFTLS